MEINKLYLKFLTKNIQNYFLIDEVDRIFKEKYKVNELDKTNFIDLKEDPYVDYSNIVKCYEIYDENILENLYSDEEKAARQEFYETFIVMYSEEEYNKIMKNRINIILESVDGKRISGYTIQGRCDYIVNEIIVFIGVELEDQNLDNRKFVYYLNALEKTGYL